MQKSRFPVKNLVISLAVLIVITGIVTGIILYLKGPSKSAPVTYEPLEYELNETEKERDLRTEHFHLRYQNTLDTVSDISGGDKTALEIYRLSSSSLESRRRMVITIKTLPPDGYAGESSYRLRQNNPDTYSEQTLRLGDNEYILFVEVNGNERTAFTQARGKLAMLAYTISVPDADPQAEMEALLAAFTWLN